MPLIPRVQIPGVQATAPCQLAKLTIELSGESLRSKVLDQGVLLELLVGSRRVCHVG
jgi:hypothetical protein